MSKHSIDVSVDLAADAAYVRLSSVEVDRTVDVTDAVLVDLDVHGVVVGIEVLGLEAEIPFETLVADYHVHSKTVELLRLIRPSVGGFLSNLSLAPDSDTTADDAKLQPST